MDSNVRYTASRIIIILLLMNAWVFMGRGVVKAMYPSMGNIALWRMDLVAYVAIICVVMAVMGIARYGLTRYYRR